MTVNELKKKLAEIPPEHGELDIIVYGRNGNIQEDIYGIFILEHPIWDEERNYYCISVI